MTFYKPVFGGDAVCCYAAIERIGNTSITTRVQAWAIHQTVGDGRIKVLRACLPTWLLTIRDCRERRHRIEGAHINTVSRELKN